MFDLLNNLINKFKILVMQKKIQWIFSILKLMSIDFLINCYIQFSFQSNCSNLIKEIDFPLSYNGIKIIDKI